MNRAAALRLALLCAAMCACSALALPSRMPSHTAHRVARRSAAPTLAVEVAHHAVAGGRRTSVRDSSGELTVRGDDGGLNWRGTVDVKAGTEAHKWVWSVLQQAVDGGHLGAGTYCITQCDACRFGLDTHVTERGRLELRRWSADPLFGDASPDWAAEVVPAKAFFTARVAEHKRLISKFPAPELPKHATDFDDDKAWGLVHIAHWGGGNVQPWQMSVFTRAAAHYPAQGATTQVQLWQSGQFTVAHTGFKLRGTTYYADGVYCAQGLAGQFKTFVKWYGGVGGVFDAAAAEGFTHAVITDAAQSGGLSLSQIMLWREGLPFYSKELLYIPIAFGQSGEPVLTSGTAWTPSEEVQKNLALLSQMAAVPIGRTVGWLRTQASTYKHLAEPATVTALYLGAVAHLVGGGTPLHDCVRQLNTGDIKAQVFRVFGEAHQKELSKAPGVGVDSANGAYNTLFVNGLLVSWPEQKDEENKGNGLEIRARKNVATWVSAFAGHGIRPFNLRRSELIALLRGTSLLASGFTPIPEIARNA